MTGAWARDLDLDLDLIQRWGATAVVSLITDQEIDYLGVRNLSGAVRDRYMEWWHLPIEDGLAIPFAGSTDTKSAGNGSLMRLAPCRAPVPARPAAPGHHRHGPIPDDPRG